MVQFVSSSKRVAGNLELEEALEDEWSSLHTKRSKFDPSFQHFLQCPPGLLGKHFEKLIQCDLRLKFLSRQEEILLESLYFEPRISGLCDSNVAGRGGVELKSEGGPSIFGLQDPLLPFAGQSSSCKNEQDSHGSDEMRGHMAKEGNLLDQRDEIRVPGLYASMSMSDIVNHIGNCITEQMTSSGEDLLSQDIFQEITQYLLDDSQHPSSTPDEQSLMSRVNSLCCLLQKDSNYQTEQDAAIDVHDHGKNVEGSSVSVSAPDDVFDSNSLQAMSRKDSVGDFLLNLPRIASLPRLFFNNKEDSNIKSIYNDRS